MKGEELPGYREKVHICVFVHMLVCINMDPCICVCLIKKHVFMSGMFLSTESSRKRIIFFSSFPIFPGCDSTQRGEGPYSPPGGQD